MKENDHLVYLGGEAIEIVDGGRGAGDGGVGGLPMAEMMRMAAGAADPYTFCLNDFRKCLAGNDSSIDIVGCPCVMKNVSFIFNLSIALLLASSARLLHQTLKPLNRGPLANVSIKMKM